MQLRVEYSDGHGVIDFGWGACTLNSTPGALAIRAEARDNPQLQHLIQRITERLERIGARTGVRVFWDPVDDAAAPVGSAQTATPHGNAQRAKSP